MVPHLREMKIHHGKEGRAFTVLQGRRCFLPRFHHMAMEVGGDVLIPGFQSS